MEIMRTSGVKLGEILISRGVANEADVFEVLRVRTLEIIYDLFLWERANFEFHDSITLSDEFIRVAIRPTNVIMEGIYRVDEWRRYRERIPSDRVVLDLVPGRIYRDLRLGKDAPKILWLVKKRMSVGEICYNMHASPFEVYSQLFNFLSNGLVQVVDELPEEISPSSKTHRMAGSSAELLGYAAEKLRNHSTREALDIIREVLETEPNNSEAQEMHSTAEREFVKKIFSSSLPPSSTPRVLLTTEALKQQRIGPKEGFILSRINGTWDVKAILSVSPLSEADSLEILRRLLDDGIIGI